MYNKHTEFAHDGPIFPASFQITTFIFLYNKQNE